MACARAIAKEPTSDDVRTDFFFHSTRLPYASKLEFLSTPDENWRFCTLGARFRVGGGAPRHTKREPYVNRPAGRQLNTGVGHQPVQPLVETLIGNYLAIAPRGLARPQTAGWQYYSASAGDNNRRMPRTRRPRNSAPACSRPNVRTRTIAIEYRRTGTPRRVVLESSSGKQLWNHFVASAELVAH